MNEIAISFVITFIVFGYFFFRIIEDIKQLSNRLEKNQERISERLSNGLEKLHDRISNLQERISNLEDKGEKKN